ncbi:unnamed protein product [Protopolystoma xenopodis]|uniref:MAM domain-containing protein n=1 Tax=Protopolystoma xenopodis TaxID=117903 RepID=A0A3S4ZB12_9PLAT|nr:unnamed protein product [Protopolystoma xenopodis]
MDDSPLACTFDRPDRPICYWKEDPRDSGAVWRVGPPDSLLPTNFSRSMNSAICLRQVSSLAPSTISRKWRISSNSLSSANNIPMSARLWSPTIAVATLNSGFSESWKEENQLSSALSHLENADSVILCLKFAYRITLGQPTRRVSPDTQLPPKPISQLLSVLKHSSGFGPLVGYRLFVYHLDIFHMNQSHWTSLLKSIASNDWHQAHDDIGFPSYAAQLDCSFDARASEFGPTCLWQKDPRDSLAAFWQPVTSLPPKAKVQDNSLQTDSKAISIERQLSDSDSRILCLKQGSAGSSSINSSSSRRRLQQNSPEMRQANKASHRLSARLWSPEIASFDVATPLCLRFVYTIFPSVQATISSSSSSWPNEDITSRALYSLSLLKHSSGVFRCLFVGLQPISLVEGAFLPSFLWLLQVLLIIHLEHSSLRPADQPRLRSLTRTLRNITNRLDCTFDQGSFCLWKDDPRDVGASWTLQPARVIDIISPADPFIVGRDDGMLCMQPHELELANSLASEAAGENVDSTGHLLGESSFAVAQPMQDEGQDVLPPNRLSARLWSGNIHHLSSPSCLRLHYFLVGAHNLLSSENQRIHASPADCNFDHGHSCRWERDPRDGGSRWIVTDEGFPVPISDRQALASYALCLEAGVRNSKGQLDGGNGFEENEEEENKYEEEEESTNDLETEISGQLKNPSSHSFVSARLWSRNFRVPRACKAQSHACGARCLKFVYHLTLGGSGPMVASPQNVPTLAILRHSSG